MRPCILLLTLLVVLSGCKPEDTPTALKLVRALVVEPQEQVLPATADLVDGGAGGEGRRGELW